MQDLTGSEFNRLINYLREQSWSYEKIVKLIEYITR
ncbi:unknown [Acidiphilium sp. CAG:727]|nr:unknown [Acidiphilium sp. CAG:727]